MTSSRSIRPESISVIIPVKDGRFLDEALESVFAQEYRPVEAVVIDSSDDGVAWVAERFGPSVRYARQEPRGIGAARNLGVDLGTGDLLAFLDSDDLFEPGRLTLQTSALERDPTLDAVFGRVSEFVQPGLPEGIVAMLRAPRESFPSHLSMAMLIRRTAFARIGPFATDYVVGETVEWYARASSSGLRSVMLDDVVVRRRLHGSNTGIKSWDARSDFVRVAREALAHRRSADDRSVDPQAP